jgi:para-nitrobenzyl esterase
MLYLFAMRKLLSLFFIFASSQIIAQPIVQTQSGKISGAMLSDDIRVFKGIPFAAAPVGELRWKAPQPVKPWTDVKVCRAYGASPMQGTPAPFGPWTWGYLIPKEPISEDCLYLNVWSGAKSNKEKRAVLVWIYGGGFTSGGSGCAIYDGEAMAKKGIVFVSINYRVGIFGFFAHPELTKESGVNASGNYGLMDQVAALQWVKKNIAAFGGDPNNVTIAGQSAGSMSVNCMVATPLAKGLFQKAIAQSGSNFTRANALLADAEKEGVKLAAGASIKDLRNMPAETLMKKPSNLRGPVIDGYVLPQHIADIFEQGKNNPVDLLIGWNEDEGILFGPPKKAEDFTRDITHIFGADADKALTYYKANTDDAATKAQLDLSRDQVFGMPNYRWASIEAAKGRRVFVYRFARKVPATGELARYGAFHTGEVPYAYDNLKYGDRPYEAADHDVANLMSSYWFLFILNGDPNTKGLPLWPRFDTSGKMMMRFDVNSVAVPMADAPQLDLLYTKMYKN